MSILCNIFIIGDMHYCQNTIYEINYLEIELFDLLKKTQYDAIVCLGDMYDKQNTPDIMSARRIRIFLEKLATYSDIVIVLVGNHDRKNNQLPENYDDHHLNFNIPNVTIVDQVKKIKIKDIYVTCVPYYPNDAFVKNDDCTVYFAHQEFEGCRLKSDIVSTAGTKWNINNTPVISGHIHGENWFKNIYYLGTPYQKNFSESQVKKIGHLQILDAEIGNDIWVSNDNERICKNMRLITIPIISVPRKYTIKIDSNFDISKLDLKHKYILEVNEDIKMNTTYKEHPHIRVKRIIEDIKDINISPSQSFTEYLIKNNIDPEIAEYLNYVINK